MDRSTKLLQRVDFFFFCSFRMVLNTQQKNGRIVSMCLVCVVIYVFERVYGTSVATVGSAKENTKMGQVPFKVTSYIIYTYFVFFFDFFF